ncbi:MAG: lytic transglycosylase domain-containing protein [Gammaproteobacteria bacterium]|nr:lytic transglycosylase domain-containing protein [Gammaproteobacteria bacterium]
MRQLFISCLMLFVLSCNSALANVNSAGKPDPELRKLLTKAIKAADSFDDRFDAEVWLVDMSKRLEKFVDDKKHRLNLLRNIHREASRAQLVPELVLAVIEVESRFDHFAISKSGAQGLMQVMPFWLKEIGHPEDNLVDINTNLRMGCTILKYYMDMEKNDLHNALARYNGSYGSRKYSNKVLEALRINWRKR